LALLLAAPILSDGERIDPLAPKTRAEDALTLQLHTATLITADLETALRFYRDGLGLTARGPLPVDSATREIQRRLWGIPSVMSWELYLLERPTVPGTIQIRLLVLDRETPLMHSTWDGREPGTFSLGFPTTDLPPWDRELRAMGFDSMNPLSEYRVPHPDGSDYRMQETILKAPDFMHAVTLSRRDGMPQLGPVDPETGRGGPVYSAQILEDSHGVLSFYTEVLGLELRSDRQWKSSGSKGALAVPDGTVFRFAIVYSPGARFGHLLFLDFQGKGLPPTGVEPRPPNRGLAMWSFPVRDLAEIENRVEEHGTPVVGRPFTYESPSLGRHRAMTVLAPNGFLVELFEPVSAPDAG
jgi:catechol 2,3-dioxygenase-like lactoylglutathione lyase family enzyme